MNDTLNGVMFVALQPTLGLISLLYFKEWFFIAIGLGLLINATLVKRGVI